MVQPSLPQSTGLINLDKPAGPTSARMVTSVKHLLSRRCKVGHAGTLDPFATGVLLILVGNATKLSEQFMGLPKTYLATVRLGATTPTDDLTAPATDWPDAIPPSQDSAKAILRQFEGTINQRPPDFCALRIGGRRAYSIARAGEAPKLSNRPVRIDSIELVHYNWPEMTIRVRCGRGTYIRSLARDIGAELNVGGYLTSLRREAIGHFDVSSAITLETLLEHGVQPYLQPVAIQPPPGDAGTFATQCPPTL